MVTVLLTDDGLLDHPDYFFIWAISVFVDQAVDLVIEQELEIIDLTFGVPVQLSRLFFEFPEVDLDIVAIPEGTDELLNL